jgi:hypothetical protein
MTMTAQGSTLHVANSFSSLGDRLIRFGQALQNPETTVAQLTTLATSCGIALKLRAVAETGNHDDA